MQQDTSARVRGHHYFFAHVLLPNVLFKSPDVLINVGREQRLLSLWQQAGREVASQIAKRRADVDASYLPPDGLQCTLEDLGTMPAAIIELPHAERSTEVIYAVAIPPSQSSRLARYFVLEWSAPMSNIPFTVIAEWTPQGRRRITNGPPRFDDGGIGLALGMIQFAAEKDYSKPLEEWNQWLPAFLRTLERDFSPLDLDALNRPAALRRLLRGTFLEMVRNYISA